MNKTMAISPIRTAVFHQGENLKEFVINNIDPSLLRERSLLAVTTKIVSLSENRTIPCHSIDKKSLILQEADHFLGEIGYGATLTIKNSLLLAAAGIDESNSENGNYILYPKDPYHSAESLRQSLCQHFNRKELGIIITDSRTGPLRSGIIGVTVAFAGFHPVCNMIGRQDLFGRELKMTKINHTDSLAAAAVLMMGEADECCPLAVIHNAPVEFTESPRRSDLEIPPQEDMYLPLYKHLLKK
ncbi:MAG: coenzyme F420-0:L-glutamate ligase [Pseudobdellovibrionaceae bacterium]